MTNIEMLKSKIDSSGLKINYICEKLGLSYPAFRRRIDGCVDFNTSEILKMCSILGIQDPQERDAIFFAN